mgnify:CR=1 FL=1
MSAAYATKNPIKCSTTHNSETYEVAVWPLDTNPVDMEYEETISIVAELCDFWNTYSSAKQSRWSKTKFNYWAWYIPTPEQQSAGQNWIRCDAMTVKDYNESNGDYVVTSWKGKRLDIR